MSAVLITFANQKGGAGKSTLSTISANLLTQVGLRCCIVDCDHQESIYKMRQRNLREYEREGIELPEKMFDVILAGDRSIGDIADDYDEQYDIIFFDMPGNLKQENKVAGGKVENTAISIISICDLVIVPLTPNNFDLEASKEALIRFTQIRDIIRKKGIIQQMAIILNRLDTRSESKDLINRIQGMAEGFGVDFFRVYLKSLAEYARIDTLQPMLVTEKENPLYQLTAELMYFIKQVQKGKEAING